VDVLCERERALLVQRHERSYLWGNWEVHESQAICGWGGLQQHGLRRSRAGSCEGVLSTTAGGSGSDASFVDFASRD
jgi:hypothetical protein